MKKMRFLLLAAVLLLTLIPIGSVRSDALSPDDLIQIVNELRRNNGLPAIDTDSDLMSAAQAHSDFLASTFDKNIPSQEKGHIGEDDSNVRDRVIAAGYNLAAGMNVVENWAGDSIDTTLTDIVYKTWALDDDQKANMLNEDAVAIGAGISESESGSLYFVLNIGVQYGSENSASDTDSGVYSTVPTYAATYAVALVQVVTPQADGRIVHIVDTGQTLWSIAAAYDITVDELKDLNNFSDEDVIAVGQEIVVQVGYTATPSPTVTATVRPPTRTPVPAQTVQAVNVPEESGADDDGGESFLGMSRQTMGLALILICGAGLALIVWGNTKKKKDKEKAEAKKDKDDDLPGPDFEL